MLVQMGLDVPAIAPKRVRGRAATVGDSQQLEDSQTPDDSQALNWGSEQLDYLSQPLVNSLQQAEGFSQQHEKQSQQPEKGCGRFAENQEALINELQSETDFSQQPEPALAQDNPESWRHGAPAESSQRLVDLPEYEPLSGWPYLDRPGYQSQQPLSQQSRPPGHLSQQSDHHLPQPDRYSQHPAPDAQRPRQLPHQAGHEWLDLSQARVILDENGQPLPLTFEALDPDEFEYELVPLGSDELVPLRSEL